MGRRGVTFNEIVQDLYTKYIKTVLRSKQKYFNTKYAVGEIVLVQQDDGEWKWCELMQADSSYIFKIQRSICLFVNIPFDELSAKTRTQDHNEEKQKHVKIVEDFLEKFRPAT